MRSFFGSVGLEGCSRDARSTKFVVGSWDLDSWGGELTFLAVFAFAIRSSCFRYVDLVAEKLSAVGSFFYP